MGIHQTKNGQVAQHKTTAKVAAAYEMSTYRGAKSSIGILVPLCRGEYQQYQKN
ncbi:MAG: hypothetical protein O4860_02420 [Trichodesmium sp. St2_bin2_1]|nr:hypothetical protein [Trichodesmium sp. St2_bin2_1]